MVTRVETLRGWHPRRPLVPALRAFAQRVASPHRAALANLMSMPLTLAGAGCIDTGVFYASTVAGWIITGLSLVVLEHLIADEP